MLQIIFVCICVDFHQIVSKKGQYVRVVYTNGAVAQGSFKLRTQYPTHHANKSTKTLEILDNLESSLNHIDSNSGFTASRLSNIQDWCGTQGGDGTGTKTGPMIDNIASSNNNISSNSTLTASRLNNIQNHINPVPIGSQANLMDAQSCVAAGTFSSVVDWGTTTPPKRVMISVLASSSVSATGFEIYVSHDNVSWAVLFPNHSSKTQYLSIANSGGSTIDTQGAVCIDWCGMRYLKIKVFCLATFTATAIGTA